MNYVPLYIKTHNSLLESMIKVSDLIDYAKENNIKTLTITDNNMYGVMDFYIACRKNNIKPIIGLEIKIDNYIVILYAMNYNGYKNIIKISTIKSEKELNESILAQHANDIICIVPYDSINKYNDLNKIYKEIFISYKNNEERLKLNYKNLVYMNSILYFNKEDAQYINYLTLIKNGKTEDEIYFENSNNNMLRDFNYIKEKYPYDLDNNYKIENMCNIVIPFNNNLLPVYNCPDGLDSYSYLKILCQNGMRKIFGSRVGRIYVERVKYELEIINKMGFCNYFLIVHDYIKYAKDNKILVGPGRGSAAGSLVAFLLGITTVDPIKYNLFFERFLNIERITMPDIDVDFEYTRRDEVITYCIEKYGNKKVAPIITFGTLGAKQAIRDVSRAININLDIVDKLCKNIDSRLNLIDNYNNNPRIKEMLANNFELTKMYKIASRFEGLKRHTSIHAAGIVMSNVDLDEVIPLDRNHNGLYTTAYSMEHLEDIGLLKMDFLSLKNLTLINDILDEVKFISFDNIPLDDNDAIKIFNEVNTKGIFQFESDGMMNFLRKFKPTNFEDVVASLALYRPGPMNNIETYIRRKNGKEKIDYIHPTLEPVLKNTYGIIIYQEQIMQIANIMADYSLGEADLLRRAMSKKKEDILLEEKEKFITRSIKKGYSKEISDKVYGLILKFASYGFNRAHAVAYGIISYKMAYLKAKFPNVFIKHLLSAAIGSEVKTKEYIYEAKVNNIEVLKPDINLSGSDYAIESDGIRYPLTNIKGIGNIVAENILEERKKGRFKDIYDFVFRCNKKNINKKIIENLIDAGCFNSFGINNKTLHDNLDVIINYGEIGALLSSDESLKPIIEYKQEYDLKTLMDNELRVFGFYLTNHPVTAYRSNLNKKITIKEIKKYFNTYIDIIIMVDRIKKIDTKDKNTMMFITASDEADNVDLVLFPKVYEQNKNISVGDILLVNVKVEKRFDKYQLIANEIKVLK
ncbi:MAG TPA: DNA polymerase III subunit alpha [Tenericutes bacterium]|nr:DNA polymerase III subunit alpha [Mycoplasmatota bacterium]